MPFLINLRLLARRSLHLCGELTAAEFDLDPRDDLVRVLPPLQYDLVAEASGTAVLVQGRLELALACTCARCLKPFERRLDLRDWSCQVFPGDDDAPVHGDCLDLTMRVREDTVLALPQHPLCEPECRGLPSEPPGQAPKPGRDRPRAERVSVWSELNKLKW